MTRPFWNLYFAFCDLVDWLGPATFCSLFCLFGFGGSGALIEVIDPAPGLASPGLILLGILGTVLFSMLPNE